VHGKLAQTYSPVGACNSSLVRILERKRINVSADGSSKGVDTYAPSKDAKVAGVDGKVTRANRKHRALSKAPVQMQAWTGMGVDSQYVNFFDF
jgi:hypothetical protein